MLLRLAAFLREGHSALATAMDDLAIRIIPHARGDAACAALCQNPAEALERAAAHIHLRDLGYPDVRMDALLHEIVLNTEQAGPERLPNHDLEREWLTQIWSGDENPASIANLLRQTCLARSNPALASSTGDLYAFTHVMLYASDMGRRHVGWPRRVHDIITDCEAALAAAIDADNFDLTAELLWTWPMGRLPWSQAATFCFGVLAAAQDQHGFLPGPDYITKPDELTEPAHLTMPGHNARRAHAHVQDEQVAQTSYHTTLVMGFLCAAAQRPGASSPPADVASTTASHGTIEHICSLLLPRPKRRWQHAFERLDGPQKEALVPFLLTIALRRAYASKNLARVHECLEVALSCNQADSPACRDGLAFLRRARIFAETKSACLQ